MYVCCNCLYNPLFGSLYLLVSLKYPFVFLAARRDMLLDHVDTFTSVNSDSGEWNTGEHPNRRVSPSSTLDRPAEAETLLPELSEGKAEHVTGGAAAFQTGSVNDTMTVAHLLILQSSFESEYSFILTIMSGLSYQLMS